MEHRIGRIVSINHQCRQLNIAVVDRRRLSPRSGYLLQSTGRNTSPQISPKRITKAIPNWTLASIQSINSGRSSSFSRLVYQLDDMNVTISVLSKAPDRPAPLMRWTPGTFRPVVPFRIVNRQLEDGPGPPAERRPTTIWTTVGEEAATPESIAEHRRPNCSDETTMRL